MCNDNLQRLQNPAARIITRRNRSNEAMNILVWSDIKTVRGWEGINVSYIVFKCLHDLVPKYLISEYFIRNSSIHLYNTRRRNDIHLDEPKPKLSLGERTFIHTLKHFCLILYHQELKHLLRCYLSRTLLD